MILKTDGGKEIRVPGRAVETGKQREGALGKLDAMAFSKYKELGQAERLMNMKDAFAEKGNTAKAGIYGRRIYIAMMEKYRTLTRGASAPIFGYTSYRMEHRDYVDRLLYAARLAEEFGLDEGEPKYAAKTALAGAIQGAAKCIDDYEQKTKYTAKDEIRQETKAWGPIEMNNKCSEAWQFIIAAYRASEYLGKEAEKEAAKIHWKYLVTWWFGADIHDYGFPCYMEAAKHAIKYGLGTELKKTIELACGAYMEEKGNAEMAYYNIRMLEKMLEVGLPREFFDNAAREMFEQNMKERRYWRCADIAERAGMKKELELAKNLEEQEKTKQ